MTIKEWIRQKIIKFLGIEKLTTDPNAERLTFINNDEAIKSYEVKANRIWYIGNGDELLNFYTESQINDLPQNPIYNRNKRNYFWALSTKECDIKRIHSGIPNAIITAITNIVGYPDIKESSGIWQKIEEVNDFRNKLTQQARPLTLAEGWGAWKINFNKELCKFPIWEYYDAENVEYIYKSGMMMGIVYKSYYKDEKGKDYVLLETRYKAKGNSYISYDLFKLEKNNEIIKVKLSDLPELCDLPEEGICIPELDMILGTPSRYFYDPQNPKYGKSIYAGKLDLFDMLDEIWSQASQTNRVSTPVEYYSPDVLDRGANGQIGTPQLYNRQFMQKAGVPDGEGNLNQDIITTQPDLNFDKYGGLSKDVLDYIFTGVLSPATLGIDVAKKDNADAQREKEKISIMTRNNIIDQEQIMMREIILLSIYIQEFMESGKISVADYDIDVKYNEFANPSTESMLSSLLPALTQGGMTPKLFVDMVYGDSLDPEAKAEEVQWITDKLQQENVDLEGLLGNETGTNNAMGQPAQIEEPMEIPEE